MRALVSVASHTEPRASSNARPSFTGCRKKRAGARAATGRAMPAAEREKGPSYRDQSKQSSDQHSLHWFQRQSGPERTVTIPIAAIDGEVYLKRVNCEYWDYLSRLCEEQGVTTHDSYSSEREDWIHALVAMVKPHLAPVMKQQPPEVALKQQARRAQALGARA